MSKKYEANEDRRRGKDNDEYLHDEKAEFEGSTNNILKAISIQKSNEMSFL
jgi:hypothetical protein